VIKDIFQWTHIENLTRMSDFLGPMWRNRSPASMSQSKIGPDIHDNVIQCRKQHFLAFNLMKSVQTRQLNLTRVRTWTHTLCSSCSISLKSELLFLSSIPCIL
jgi:hypothetical protein